jgi:hypothetical protein
MRGDRDCGWKERRLMRGWWLVRKKRSRVWRLAAPQHGTSKSEEYDDGIDRLVMDSDGNPTMMMEMEQ